LITDRKLLPENVDDILKKAMNIEVIRPQNLSWARIRAALGLEASNDPVPDGVYLIQDDLGLGGIFVEGDVDQMVLAIDGAFQAVFFRMGEASWELRFSPSLGLTAFKSPEGFRDYNLLPKGFIIVDGTIESLGGGTVDPFGEIFPTEDEIPSILNGVRLTIISSERISISSHLLHQGVDWSSGIPVMADSRSHLSILASGHDILGTETAKGEIVIDDDAPDGLKLQASITALKTGFKIEGEEKTIRLLGSLHSPDYDSGENRLEIIRDSRLEGNSDLLANAPRLASSLVFIGSLKPQGWRILR